MPWRSPNSRICLQKLHSSTKILRNKAVKGEKILQYDILQECQDFAILKVQGCSMGEPQMVKIPKVLLRELRTSQPAAWFLCQVLTRKGLMCVAAWDDQEDACPGTQEPVSASILMDLLLLLHVVVATVNTCGDEGNIKEGLEFMKIGFSIMQGHAQGMSFRAMARWARVCEIVEYKRHTPVSAWRASHFAQWYNHGAGELDHLGCYAQSHRDTFREKGMHFEPGLMSGNDASRTEQDGAGKHEPLPHVCRQDVSGNDSKPSQDGAGYDEPPPFRHGGGHCRHFTTCSPEHTGFFAGSRGRAMEVDCESQDLELNCVERCFVRWLDPAQWMCWKDDLYSDDPPIAAGGAPSWPSPRAAFLKPHATVGERIAFLQQTEGWLASDELTFATNRIRIASANYHVLPVAMYSHLNDEFIFEHDQFQISNTGVSLLPILYGAHWVGVEIDRQHDVPEVAILHCSQLNQNRIETLVCQVLHIPAHRLVIRHWANTTPPGMCGWALIWRWLLLTHTQYVFSQTLQDFQGLSDDRKRIVSRALDKSSRAWEVTGADLNLQQVAYTVRQAFLIHLFEFNTGVHTRLDTLAICAAGQPLSVFEQEVVAPPLMLEAVTQTNQQENPEISQQVVPSCHNTEAQTHVSFASNHVTMGGNQQVRYDEVHSRIQEFCLFPDQAASDELDHTLDLCRHFSGPVNLVPCCRWDPEGTSLQVISDRAAVSSHHLEHRALVHCQAHWFAVHVLFESGIVWVHTYGFPTTLVAQFPRFLMHVADFLQVPPHLVRAQSFAFPCPENMCGFQMLDASLQACDIQSLPWCDSQVRFLQSHDFASELAYIGHHAVALWRSATSDHHLIRKAFAVRTLFLTHLLQCQQVETHVRGGGLGDTSTQPDLPGATFASSATMGTPVGEDTRALPTLSDRTKMFLTQHIRTHIPVTSLCHCHTKGFTAQVTLKKYIQDWHDCALVSCRLIKPCIDLADRIGTLDCRHPACAHDRTTFAHVILPKEVWKAFGPDKSAMIVEAKLIWSDGTPVIDLRSPHSGLTHVREDSDQADREIRFGEFFAGGFSGWSFALKYLIQAHLPVHHAFSIENDVIMARNHALNHSRHPCVVSTQQADGLQLGMTPMEEPYTIVANIEHAWWHHLCEPIDILLASPPCQPWSRAGSEQGLEASDGRLLLLTIIQCAILQPAVLCIEEVSSLSQHKHYAWVLAFLSWAGYSLTWSEALNLADVLPHSRTRLLLVATRKNDPRVARLEPVRWVKASVRPTLESILLPSSHTCHQYAPPLEAQVFDQYFQCRLLPKRVGTTPHEIRRCRIKTQEDQHSCIMANYAFAHELPSRTLAEGGLLGSFVLYEGQVRWLAQPEIAMLFGCNSPFHVPKDPKVATHLLGNAIAVPHAMLGVLNAMAQLKCIQWTQIPLWLLDDAIATRYTSDTVMVSEHDTTQTLRLSRRDVSPTQSWESREVPMYSLRIPQDQGECCIRLAPQLPVWDTLRCLFRLPTNTVASWQPRGDSEIRLPLFAIDTVPKEGMSLDTMWIGPLALEESRFYCQTGPLVVALSTEGIFVMPRTHVETVDDMLQILTPFFSGTALALDHLGGTWELASSPPDTAFIAAQAPKAIESLSTLRQVSWNILADSMLCVTTMFQALSLLDIYCKLGLTDLLRSLGWKTLLDSSIDDSSVRGTTVQLTIQRCCHSAFAPLQDVQNVIATRLFIAFLNMSVKPREAGIDVRVKLWDSFVWTGQVQPDTPTGILEDAWLLASQHVGKRVHLRALIRGQRLNPEWNFGEYRDLMKDTSKPTNIHMILECQGGGSKAEAALKIKEDFAARALQVGFDPIETKQFAHQVYIEAGAARVRTLLSVPEEDAFIQQCGIVAKQLRISLPQLHDLEEARSKRVRASLQKSGRGQNSTPAGDLRVEEGTFCRHDGTEVSMCKDPSTPTQGVVFVEPEDIVAFAQEHSRKHEELMAVVPGVKCPLQESCCQRFHIPVLLPENDKVVITACCHSLGTQAVTIRLSDGDAAAVTDTTKVMFVTWKSECTEQQWDTLLSAPIHIVFKLLDITPSDTISGPPQGRSWRALRQAVQPAEAESFCFYARVVAAMLPVVLGKSGQCGVYTTPKSEHSNLADARYSIVWTQFTTAKEACAKAAECEHALGIVRSAKERPAYGIRTQAKHFDTLWQQLRPSDPKPQLIQGEYLYRISPVPEGATHEDVTKWIHLEKLHARPLRAINATTWILVGEADLKTAHLTWKQNAILLQPIESRQNKMKSTILAGKRPMSTVRRTWKSDSKHDLGTDPLTINDPWANASANWGFPEWTSRSSGFSGSSSSSSSKAPPSTVSSDSHVRQQREIDQIQSKIQTLENTINTQKKETATFRKEVHTEFLQVRKEVGDRVNEVKEAFQSTLTDALTQTQTALRSTFKEDFEQLKALLAAPSRKRASGGDVEMDG